MARGKKKDEKQDEVPPWEDEAEEDADGDDGDDEEEELEGTDDPDVETVERPLSEKAVRERMKEMAELQLAILDMEDDRTETLKQMNSDLKAKKKAIRKLAYEVKTKTQRVPAQMALAEAKKSRRANPRTLQDVGKDVEP